MRLRGRIAEAIRLVACLILIAVSVHIVSVLMVPSLSHADAFSLVARLGPELRLMPLDGHETLLDGKEDPDIAAAVCSFDLATGPVKLTLPAGADGFSSIALHQEGGGAFFALSNSAAEKGRLEVVALTPAQAAERAADDDPDSPSGEVRAVSSRTRGFAVFRALALYPSQRPAAKALVAHGSCQHIE
ncbi:MAG: hypothetical protein JO357_18260 [Hyphomicrobiales bacterium]|nr:hypothetical protein [Hyphomicrobiales bacterium]MBV9138999.1 hypothetical protein [Hyphomicrobiales bacterium]